MNSARRTIVLACLGLAAIPVYAVNYNFAQICEKAHLVLVRRDPYSSFLYQLPLLGALYLLAVRNSLKCDPAKTKSITIFLIVFLALVYRLFLVATPPLLSSDMYRYIWDGRVQAHGVNPYRYPPCDKALAQLQDKAVYPHINRQESPTIYPGGAQVLFYSLNRLRIRSTSAFKGAVVFFDMGSILLLTMILAELGLARERVLIYAWNPLVIYTLAGSGHLEGFMLFFVLLCFLLTIRKRLYAAVSSLAVAASLKLYPAIVLPAVLKEKKFRGVLLFSIIFLAFYLPYIGVGKKVLGFLPQYFENPNESFNLGLRAYLLKLFPGTDPLVFTGIFAAILLCAAALVWVRHKDATSALRFSYYLASLLSVLSASALQPWYVVWIIPFLALFPSPAWLYLSFAVCLSYLAYISPGQIIAWWIRNTEYIPFFVLLAAEFLVLQKSGGSLFPWNSQQKEQAPAHQERTA